MPEFVCRVSEFPCKNESIAGDLTYHTFPFEAVPAEQESDFNAPKYTRRFNVRLEVSRTLMYCGTWPQTRDRDKWLYFFAFVRQNLKTRPLPGNNELVIMQLNTWTDNQAHKDGPTQYDVTSIQTAESFLLSIPIGSQPNREGFESV